MKTDSIMKIMKSKAWAIAVFGLLACSCGDNAVNNAIDNSVYFTSVSNINTQRVTVGDAGTNLPVQVRMAKLAEAETRVTVGVNENTLKAFNETNATGYAMLPAEFYELSSNTAVIEAGSSIASAITLNIKPLSSDLGKTGLTYAVPVAIQSVTGSNASILDGSDYFIYLVVPTPIANVPVLSKGNSMKMTIKDGPITVTDYTVEFLVKIDNLGSGKNNQILFNANNAGNDADLIFSRFAASGAAGFWDKFSIKPGGADTEIQADYSFQNNKWYHIAAVVSNKAGTCSIYVNGILDKKASISGKSITINSADGAGVRGVRFGGESDTDSYFRSNIQTSEIRFWSVPRTETQIAENMYGVNPATPGLIAYWKCNEGTGSLINDVTGHGHDANLYGTPTWLTDQSVEVGQ
ncbi:MAG: DUF1735 and LamG domain-containing protein [Dysgonamonadaceae bacterium]|jgi:hypothetical protein|nr:DUF1735 and LamG domain-containing protein [Dysgonamonadaceae bacterium]